MGLVRLLLALAVAGDHFFNNVLNPRGFGGGRGVDQFVWLNGGFAVMLFYVISGFLMSLVLAHRYTADRDGTRAFYRSRFVRIFSLYWPLLAIVALLFDYDGRNDLLDRLVSLVIVGGDWFTAFRPPFNPFYGTLGPAWSIATELTFYAMAPFLLRSLRGSVLLFVASLGLRIWLSSIEDLAVVWIYQFPPAVLWCFLAGDLARRLAARWPALDDLFLPLLVLAVFALRRSMGTGSLASPWFVIMVLAFALALPGLFAATKDNRAMNALGDLSYPLYLVHLSVIVLVFLPLSERLFGEGGAIDRPEALWLLAAFGAAAIAAAAVVHVAIERPFARVLRTALEPRSVQLAD